jgi:hypothetical protein
MAATQRTLATATTLALVAMFTAACERTPTPQTTRSGDGMTMATTLNAPPAPSLVGTPIEATPSTHVAAVAPPAPEEPTARDTPALAPGATLSDAKEKTAMPLPGQTDNHFSESMKAGSNEGAAPAPDAAAPAQATERTAPAQPAS